MPIYEDENTTRDKLLELRRKRRCSVCKGALDVFLDMDNSKAFLACREDKTHEGVERVYEPTPFEREGYSAFNIPTRREMMEQDYGAKKTQALTKYVGVVSLTKPQAREILTSVYPDAPDQEIIRAVLLCASYGLNPLMKHVFLIKFNKWDKDHTEIIGVEWATVIGIKAKRLLSSRKAPYSYVDNTPRLMTEEEQLTVFGEVEKDKLWVITKGKDLQTGAQAVGYGFWPKGDKPHGTEKGNTKFNMASIRSESQMLDRLRPGEMPQGVEVVDAEYEELPPSKTKVVEKIGEAGEGLETTSDDELLGVVRKQGMVGTVEEETILSTTKGRENKTARETSARRTSNQILPSDVPDGFALEKVAHEVWRLQPKTLWNELRYSSVQNFEEARVESAWECFLKLKGARE